MDNNRNGHVTVAPRETRLQRYTKITPTSRHHQQQPQQLEVLTRLSDHETLNPSIKNPLIQPWTVYPFPYDNTTLSQDPLSKNMVYNTGVQHKPEKSLPVDSIGSKTGHGKGLTIVLAMMGLSIAAALGMSVYSLILMNTTTVVTTTTTTTSYLFRWNTTGITVAGISAGISGSASNQLNSPYHLALDAIGSLYICDRSNHRIQKYLKDATSGTTVAGISGAYGSLPVNLYYPSSILLDSSNNIYVADTYNNRIQFWSPSAPNGTTITTGLSSPWGMGYDPSSNTLYIAESSAYRIRSYKIDTKVSTIVAGDGTNGYGPSQLSSPRAVYFDASSTSLIIANTGAHTIVRWVLGDSSWTLIAGTIGSSGSLSTQLNSPYGVTLDAFSNIYVADMNNNRIQLFLSGQSTGITIAGVSSVQGNNSTLLRNPYAVALDSNRNLYVADTNNHRIQKFQRY